MDVRYPDGLERSMETGATARRPGRLRVGIVGVGRVGSAIGAALDRAGHAVVAASGSSTASRANIADLLPAAAHLPPREAAQHTDLVLLSVPDDAVGDVVAELADAEVVSAGQIVAHTSGRHGLAILEPLTRAGALPLALHPVMTFAGRADDETRLAGCFFGVTAPEPLRPIAEALVVEIGGEPAWVPEENRALYHTALASGANHLVTLVTESVELLRQAGVEEPERAISPLLGAALDNALRFGGAALTGPVARGDAETVASHLEQLRGTSPEAVAAYVAMARLTADRALRNGLLAPSDAEHLLDVLAEPGEKA